MSRTETKSTFSLALVFMSRMLGLFMVLPILTLFLSHFKDYTPTLAGLAMGAYGFTQACLQIPAGWLSDRLGRKKIIYIGLIIFAIGSLVAAYATTLHGLIVGRLLQGCGAIASAITALVADLTREQYRSRAMSIIGMGIGVSFCLAMILGPFIAGFWSLQGVFIVNAVLAIISMIVVFYLVPTPVIQKHDLNSEVKTKDLKKVFSNKELMRHVMGVFILHFSLMSLFIFIPQFLARGFHLPVINHGFIYLAVMCISFVAMIPLIIYSEKTGKMKECFILALVIMFISVILFGFFFKHLNLLILGLVLYFIAFNFLEATLPSLISKFSPVGTRGSSMGVYSTCQFLGAALGGLAGGWAMHHFGDLGIVIFALPLLAIWIVVALLMSQPPHVRSVVMAIKEELLTNESTETIKSLHQKMLAIKGVQDVVLLASEKIAYLKVDKDILDQEALNKLGRY